MPNTVAPFCVGVVLKDPQGGDVGALFNRELQQLCAKTHFLFLRENIKVFNQTVFVRFIYCNNHISSTNPDLSVSYHILRCSAIYFRLYALPRPWGHEKPSKAKAFEGEKINDSSRKTGIYRLIFHSYFFVDQSIYRIINVIWHRLTGYPEFIQFTQVIRIPTDLFYLFISVLIGVNFIRLSKIDI